MGRIQLPSFENVVCCSQYFSAFSNGQLPKIFPWIADMASFNWLLQLKRSTKAEAELLNPPNSRSDDKDLGMSNQFISFYFIYDK